MGNNVIDVKFAKQNECLPLIFKSVGPKGGDGKSAYEQALEGGYTGTEEEFNNDLKSFSDLSIKAEQGAQQAVNAAQTAQTNAQTAQTNAQSAQSYSQSAQGSAQSAAQSAQDAASSASLANIQNKITNCLTKIPQDINLKLSNGTLTLKSGSKTYRGNGDVININSDISVTYNASATVFIVVNASGNALQARPIENCFSGTSDPQTPNSIYYDTANNVIRFYTSQGVQTEVSFPVAICTATGQISSIDQVFNGFGYIGNTLFALPGVEGLIPNGRTAEGALANTKVTVSAVRKLSFSTQAQSHFGLTATTLFAPASALYNAADNTNYNPSTGNTLGFCNCGTVVTDSTGQITSFMPKYAFHAADYSGADFVISSYSDADGNWYRKYKSGWVEQGGLSANNGGIVTVSLLQKMADTNYYVSASLYSASDSADKGYFILSNKNATSFKFNASNTNDVLWYACGQGA